MQPRFGRVVTAMVTPFSAAGALDLGRAQELARRLVENGSDGLVVSGSTGEAPTLSPGEKLELFAAVVEAVGARSRGPRVPVLAGTSSYNTAESVHLTREAERTGVDGLLLVAPYYNRPSQEGLYRHFRSIAEATSLPCIVYNIPVRTGVNVLPETVVRLARDCPNIVGVKESSGGVEQPSEIARRAPHGFLVYSGDDILTLPTLAVGGCGIISVASHLVGLEIGQMIDRYRAGDVAGATVLHHRLSPLFKALFIAPNPTPLKAALRLVGFDCGGVRLPLVEVGEEEVTTLRRVLGELGLV